MAAEVVQDITQYVPEHVQQDCLTIQSMVGHIR